ncbi:p-hydroxybenzoic acid efflux pump subunit AaeB [Fundidesulfovibrio magnetotacticus]|uniref:p-hydroxybenzoic acid efflux pump subunit AaeB n=1 Tax=Fundidesulfovibrio magnetotacticus TaxID=2730080 RepID=A0A6V8LSI6_9BACT|nr:FUSC family protein [Fundidesulfovibrio magnetotacticus]GFK93930.1 p-hydroxybenzoic acid efflux pump subunit AaeB [Fundidesulfovibrio magnetotacticus]
MSAAPTRAQEAAADAREGFKVGLSVVIALGVAYALGWDEPQWAALSAIVVHRGPYGASILKSVNRVVGTLAAAVVAVALVANFSQSRWGFMAAMSAWIAVAGYMSFTSQRSYLWMKALVVSFLLVAHSDLQSADVFDVILSRTQTTVLGVLVHYLVDTFLWPRLTRPGLLTSLDGILALEAEILRDLFAGRYQGQEPEAPHGRPRMLLRQTAHFEELVEQCIIEDPRTFEERHAWRAVARTAERAVEVQGQAVRALMSCGGVNPLDACLTGARDFLDELGRRSAHMRALAAGQAPPARPVRRVRLGFAPGALRGAMGVPRTTLLVLKARLDEMEELSARMSGHLQAILADASPLPDRSPEPRGFTGLDPEALRLTLCLLAMFSACFLTYIYTQVPTGMEFVYISLLFTLQSVLYTRTRVQTLVWPFFVGYVVSLALYIVLFPKLYAFHQIALAMLAAIVLFWVFLRKTLGTWPCILLMFTCGTAITSPPTYDITSAVNIAVSLFLFFTLCYLSTEFIYSLSGENIFVSHDRWFRAALAQRADALRGPLWRSLARAPSRFTASMRPVDLARRMDEASRKLDPRDLTPDRAGAVADYVERSYLLSAQVEGLRQDYRRLTEGNPDPGDRAAAERCMERVRAVLEAVGARAGGAGSAAAPGPASGTGPAPAPGSGPGQGPGGSGPGPGPGVAVAAGPGAPAALAAGEADQALADLEARAARHAAADPDSERLLLCFGQCVSTVLRHALALDGLHPRLDVEALAQTRF